ncbi:hypothetical protein [Sphingomonas sp.]|uniref:hypothetical protein n=1 Tax=Sphingomonas sp. TaxID=28214 RepID=UPI003CC53912
MLLLLPTAQPPVVTLADRAALGCTLVGPGEAAPVTVEIDNRSKRDANAVIAFAPASQYARISASSPATSRADGSIVIAFATGSGQYRLEITPGAGAARIRMVTLASPSLTVAQGFCTARPGRRSSLPPTQPLTVDPVMFGRPWRLQPLAGRLADATCRLVARDRRVFQMSYHVTAAEANELSVAYRFLTTDLLGATDRTGTGTQFFLVAPAERMVATTVNLGDTPTTYVHTTYERMGSFVDLSRAGQQFAVGDCGASPGWIATAPAGAPR